MQIGNIKVGHHDPLLIITGPCVIESEEHTLRCAEYLKNLLSKLPFSFIFKASFDKANRSSIHSKRGPGLEEGLKILEKVKTTFDLPVTSDIHLPEQADAAKDVLDILQIPAFLCRQTDLLVSSAKTHKPVNVKKGQFVSPFDMENVVEKLKHAGCKNIMLTDRGSSFGYNNLVSDMRAIPIMQSFNVPVCFDASHSVQLPGGNKTSSGGQKEFIPTLAKSSIAAGANALFIESHPNPQSAFSDSASVLDYLTLETLLHDLAPLYALCSKKPCVLA